jgi:hypothetical protein
VSELRGAAAQDGEGKARISEGVRGFLHEALARRATRLRIPPSSQGAL